MESAYLHPYLHRPSSSTIVTLDDGAIQSEEVAMTVGDNVFGNMTQTGPTAWYVT